MGEGGGDKPGHAPEVAMCPVGVKFSPPPVSPLERWNVGSLAAGGKGWKTKADDHSKTKILLSNSCAKSQAL